MELAAGEHVVWLRRGEEGPWEEIGRAEDEERAWKLALEFLVSGPEDKLTVLPTGQRPQA